jgi:DNA ligase-1
MSTKRTKEGIPLTDQPTNSGPELNKRGVKGEVRVWRMESMDDKHRTISGIQNGKMVESKWTTCKPKNVGRSNATSPEQQAVFEVEAKYAKQRKSNYFDDINEIDNLTYFEPMLAVDWDKRKNKVVLADGVYAQPKLDGIRCINAAPSLFPVDGPATREGEPIVSIPHVEDALRHLFEVVPELILDGELYNHDLKDDFNQIASMVRKQKLTPAILAKTKELVQYHVYDVPSHPGTFSERFAFLTHIFENYLSEYSDVIKLVPTQYITDESALDELSVKWVADGYEGQMIRIDDVYQTQRRSNFLMKRKDFITEEFPVLAMEEGNGNWAGCTKRFIIQLPNDLTCEAVPRGTQGAMAALWESQKTPDWATVRHFGFTPDGKLRFPIVVDYGYGERVD